MKRRGKLAGKRRRSIRCTLCTPHRWFGNSTSRFSAKDESAKDIARQEIVDHLSPRRQLPRSRHEPFHSIFRSEEDEVLFFEQEVLYACDDAWNKRWETSLSGSPQACLYLPLWMGFLLGPLEAEKSWPLLETVSSHAVQNGDVPVVIEQKWKSC